MSDCLFCNIVGKKIPATIVYETENTLAFRDISPKAPVHVLVIPKVHIDNLMAIQPTHAKVIAEMLETVQAVAKQEAVSEKGFRLAVNNGSDAGQAVKHLHFHILAGRKLNWPPG